MKSGGYIMFNFKRMTALLTAFASAATLAAAQTSAVYALDEPDSTVSEKQEGALESGDEECVLLEPNSLNVKTMYGDVNCDSMVGVSDAVQLQRFLLGDYDELGNWQNGDFNENGMLDAVDFTMLKQQLAGTQQTGGTLTIRVADVMTGELVPDASVQVYGLHGIYEYELGQWQWRTNAEDVAVFTGLPTGDEYEYLIDCFNLPAKYGNEFGNWPEQIFFKFDGKTDQEITVYLLAHDTERNIHVGLYDWSMEKDLAEGGYNSYALIDSIKGKDGTIWYGQTPISDLALPDGEYHVDLRMHEYPLQLMDPESEFAAYIKEIYPDQEFTDQTGGIDFVVKDGKPDREICFDCGPKPGYSNYIKISCIDGMTGEPVEGVEFSVIEAPNTYAKTVGTWTSDATGTHTFDGLLHTGYGPDSAYIIRVDKVPEGYSGGYEDYVDWGYIYNYGYEGIYCFVRNEEPTNAVLNVYSFEDKSLMNDAASFRVWRTYPDEEKGSYIVYDSVNPGEAFSLPDGHYWADLDGLELQEKGYSGVIFYSRSGKQVKHLFDQSHYSGRTDMVEFDIVDGKPDRDLIFIIKPIDPSDTFEYDAEALAKYEALWGTEE